MNLQAGRVLFGLAKGIQGLCGGGVAATKKVIKIKRYQKKIRNCNKISTILKLFRVLLLLFNAFSILNCPYITKKGQTVKSGAKE